MRKRILFLMILVLTCLLLPAMASEASATEYKEGTIDIMELREGDVIYRGVTVESDRDFSFAVYETPGPYDRISAYYIIGTNSWTTEDNYYIVSDPGYTRMLVYPTSPITFDPNNGTVGGTTDPTTLHAIKETDKYCDVSSLNPYKPGSNFLGWYTEDGETLIYDVEGKAVNDGIHWEDNIYQIEGARRLIAKWEPVTSVTFRYFPNGGIEQPDNYTQWTVPADYFDIVMMTSHVNYTSGKYQLTRPGYTATGYYAREDGSYPIHEDYKFYTYAQLCEDYGLDPDTCGNVIIDLYAQWTPNFSYIKQVVDNKYGQATLPYSAATDEVVCITATPKTGCRLDKIIVYRTDDPTQTISVDSENRFVMPGYPVTVEVVFVPYQNEITLNFATPEFGTCAVDRSAAGVGDVVTITAAPNKGCFVEVLTVTAADPAYTVTVEQDGTFVMPPCPVTVDVRYAIATYTITVQTPDGEQGTLEVDRTQAIYGDLITVNAQPAEGYAIRAIVIVDENGKELAVGETFSMPDSSITVRVSFMVIPTYTVTIPATVSLNSQPMTLAVNDVVMEAGMKLQVILHTDLTVRTAEGAVNTYSINGGTVTDGSAVLSVDGGGTPESPKNNAVDLYFARDAEPQYSGEYKGTISFTIRIVDTAFEYQ